MRKFGIIVSGISVVYGLISCIMFFKIERIARRYYLEPIIGKGDLIFLWSFVLFTYLLMLFVKIKMDTKFNKAYKTTSSLFIWSSIISLVLSSIFILVHFVQDEYGIVLYFANWVFLCGMTIATTLSLTGFAIDSARNKRKDIQIHN